MVPNNCLFTYLTLPENNGLQVRLVLRYFFLHDFFLTRLENLHDFLNLRDNFRFNAMWHRRYVVTLIEFAR
jgi:hypothetical protein